MTRPMTRRALLAAAPAAALPIAATALPALTSSAAGDPIVPLYHEWLAARAEWNRLARMPGNEEWKWPESLAAEDREEEALRQIAALVPASREGLAAVAHLLWSEVGPSHVETSPEYQKQCAEPASMMIAALWRLATGLDGTPPAPK